MLTADTLISTPSGEVCLGDLRPDDKVLTRDNGVQEVKWVCKKAMTGRQLLDASHLRPIHFAGGSLGKGLPTRDMMVSPNHRMLVGQEQTCLTLGQKQDLAAAKHLVDHNAIQQIDTTGVQYIQLMFDNHEIVKANGTWTECFQPEDYSMGGLGNSQRNEVFEVFPEIRLVQDRTTQIAAAPTRRKRVAGFSFR